MWPSAVALLAAASFTFAAAAIAALCAMYRKNLSSRLAAAAAAAGSGLYGLALLGSGLVSPARELGAGEEKYICELDCHLAYALSGISRQREIYTITLRMRFDETTISGHRGNFPLTPGGRRVALIDADGTEYRPLETMGLKTRLRPGESSPVKLKFQLPENVRPVYLRFEDADPLKRLLLGSETAPLHRRTVFRLS